MELILFVKEEIFFWHRPIVTVFLAFGRLYALRLLHCFGKTQTLLSSVFFFFLNQNITFTHNLNKFNPFSQKGLIDSLTASYSYSTSYGEFRLWKQLPSISWALGFTQEQGLLLDWPSFCVFPGKSRYFLT